ncbi:MAG: translation initiation factor IF-3 [Planctomycetes bacterium]|nr:translation initiation factor IF-3 [Planctomycetota bacterium]
MQNKQQQQRINEEIRSSEVRVIGEHGEQLGILPIQDAIRKAYEAELDLVEVAPNGVPPVCRIMNFGKFKYEQQKRTHAQRKKGQSNELKELRLGRSIKVEKHDLEFKLKKAREMLGHGFRLQVFLQLRGREISHANLGLDLLLEFARELEDVAKLDMPPKVDRRRVNMLLAPLPSSSAKAKKKPAVKKQPTADEPVQAPPPAEPEADGAEPQETPEQ